MLKRGMSKKGQEGFSWPTLGALLLVVIVVVLLVLGLTGVLDPIFDKLNLFPGSGLAGLVKACDTYVQADSKTDYCTFREVKVDGQTLYTNCVNEDIQKDMMSSNQGKYSCGDDEKKTCIALFKQGVKSPVVVGSQRLVCNNAGIVCEGDAGLGGKLADSCPPKDPNTKAVIEADKDKTKPITKYTTAGDEKDKTCCIVPLS